MGRSLKKGPYVVERLLEKVMKADASGSREPIKTWARACTIVPEFVGKHFAIHDGREVRQAVRHRRHGRAQARRVRPHPHLPRPRRQGIEVVADHPRSKRLSPRDGADRPATSSFLLI